MNNQKFSVNAILIVLVVIIVGFTFYIFLTKLIEPVQYQDTTISLDDSLPAGGSAGRGDESGITSPDRKRLIEIEQSEGEGKEGQVTYYVKIDGKKGGVYNYVGTAVFSPDSQKYAYGAGNGNKQFIVLDGQELKYYDYVKDPVFSPDSSRFAYVASIGDGYPNWKQFLVLDGAEGKKYQNVQLANSEYGTGFSSNSKHIVYSASENNKWFIVVDGVERAKYDRISMLTISPDGRKVTYEGQIDGVTKIITEALD